MLTPAIWSVNYLVARGAAGLHGVGDMGDQRIEAGASLGLEDGRHGNRVAGVGGEAIDGLGRQQDQIAVRQRLKLFYRPAGLPGSASEAVEGLAWRARQPGLIEVSNPSAFNVSLVNLQLDSPGQSRQLADYVLLRPGASLTLEAPSPLPAQSRVAFSELTDIGLQKRHHIALP